MFKVHLLINENLSRFIKTIFDWKIRNEK